MNYLKTHPQPITTYMRVCLFFVFVLWLSCTFVSVGAMVLGGYSLPADANPFVDFADIMPGQFRGTLEAYNFICSEANERYSQTTYCSYRPSTGMFSMVEVLVDRYSIQEVDFVVRANVLNVGDLILLWGKPSVHLHDNSINFIWKNGFGATTEYAHRRSFSLLVRKVYVMREQKVMAY